MSLYDIFDLIGGLAVFLFGMLMMNNSLTALAGGKLRSLLLILTKTKFRGYLTGFGVTILNQSSSATTVLEAVLVGAGLMTFRQSLPITLGAELGSTFLGQLFAFPKITSLYPLFIAIGFFAFLLVSTKRHKSAANTILGFGLLFLGMSMMSASIEPLKRSPFFLDAMARIEEPILGILVGLGFTMIVQSSGATSGLVIAMAIAGTINLAQAVPLNLGASIGTCVTAVIGSLSLNREAKRSAYIHVLFQTMGVFIAFVLLMVPWEGDRLYLVLAKEVTALLTGGRDNIPRQIAMAHTLMPVVNHLVIFPLLPLIERAFNRLIPPAPRKDGFGPQYISEATLKEPSVALYQVKQELLRMAPIIESMLESSLRIFSDRKIEASKEVKELDDRIDILRRETVLYLTKIAKQPLTDGESSRQVAYLFIANELENLADVIDRNILDRAKKLVNKGLHFSEDGLEDVAQLVRVVSSNFRCVMRAFREELPAEARSLLAESDKCWDLQREYRIKHFKRLNEGVPESLETTEIHMDLLNHLHRINRHVYHVAQTLVELGEASTN